MTINKRLSDEIEALNVSISDIARQTKISRRTIYDIMSEGKSVKCEYLTKLREAYGLDVNYILTGERLSAQTRVEEDQAQYMRDKNDFQPIPYWGGEITVAGIPMPEAHFSKAIIAFSQSWIHNQLHMSWRDLYMVKMEGNWMSPMFEPGDELVINTKRKEPRKGPGYLVEIDKRPYIKLIDPLQGDRLKVYTCSPRQEPFEIERHSDNFNLVGEVVANIHVSEYF